MQGNDTHCRRCPLIQGNLEIWVEVTIIIIEMDIKEENVLAMEKYKVLTEHYYQDQWMKSFPFLLNLLIFRKAEG